MKRERKECATGRCALLFTLAALLVAGSMLITGCKSSKAAAGESPEIGTETPVMAPDVLPEFPGGTSAMQQYLKEHIIYPEKAQKEGTQGRVFVQFVVERNGAISRVKVIRGVSPELDAEACRVIKAMPRWKPGKKNGKKVACIMNAPIAFFLR